MSVNFRPVDAAPPRERVKIPENVRTAMDRTYERGEWLEISVRPDDGIDQFISLCRLYARRGGRKITAEFYTERGIRHLRIRMRDTRTYVKKSNYWLRRTRKTA